MTTLTVVPDSRVVFHSLVVRPDDDDPDTVVVGRYAIGEFVELPAIYGAAIALLSGGLPVAAAEERLADEHGVEADLTELVEALAGLGFVGSVDGARLPDPARDAPPSHLRRLTERHVAWLFGRPVKALWLAVVGAALVSLATDRELVPGYRDFFWSDYVGLTVLVNTVMMSIAISVHELMHLMAARSLGAPGRIGFGTRLHNLVVQTDVTGVWGVPRRSRYRVYLAGMAWDAFLIASVLLLVAHVAMPGAAREVLRALVVTVLLAVPFQLQVYMRTDLYFVLRELLRTRNLFDDGIAYARYLLARVTSASRRRPCPVADPTTGLAPHERRATRVYSVFLVLGATLTLASFALFGAPIAISALARAVESAAGGPLPAALDSVLFIVIEGGIQVLFLVTFVRSHRHWFRRKRGPGAP